MIGFLEKEVCMIKVNDIKEPTFNLYDPQDKFVGTVKSMLSMMDVRLQIKKAKVSGYYITDKSRSLYFDEKDDDTSPNLYGFIINKYYINDNGSMNTTPEKFFDEYDYPDSEEHKKQHQELLEKAGGLKTKFDAGEKVLTIEVMNFLRDWLHDHIVGSDKEFGPFLNEKGVK